MTAFERLKIQQYKNQFGDMSAKECLALAIESAETLKTLPSGDPAKPRFYYESEKMFDYACLKEKEENDPIHLA